MEDVNEITKLVDPQGATPVKLPVKLIVEFLGTLTFVFFGAGTAAHIGFTDEAGPSIVAAAAHGIVTMVLIYLWADVSGAHFNAGPTITEMIWRKMPLVHGALYLLAQASGALTAGGLLLVLYGSSVPSSASLGTPVFNVALDIGAGRAFLIEFAGGFFLMTTAFICAHKGHSPAISGLAVGGALFVIFLFGATLDGAAMNPWRWLGPGTFQSGWWIYLVGSPAGFLVGYTLNRILHAWIPIHRLR